MSRIRRLGALAAATIFTGALITSQASATGQSATAAPPILVTPANTSYVLSPLVTEPSQPNVPLGIQLGNRAAVPSVAQVVIGVYCWDKTGKKYESVLPARIVTVPGDPSPTKGTNPMWIEQAPVNVPAACQSNGMHSKLFPDGAFYANVGPVGGKAEWMKLSNFWIGWTFNYSNKVKNLDLKTFGTQAESAAHHTLPVKWRTYFESVPGIYTVDDPQYLVWWCSRAGVKGNHPSMAKNYNDKWQAWIDKNPHPTRDQVLKARDTFSNDPLYVYKCP
ncbi:hypothetical protein ACFVWG_21095 [Kribbella sp. NPDC058245]|uniref:hypothetical protein n=1 Tax=Kribbella sp. NPDC058245 TaxID=3346399 RepID=UPI0036EFED19